jgi:excinuclease UvrABC helicase subunit UvrB
MIPTALNKKKNNELAQKLNPYAVKEIHTVDETDFSDPKVLDKAIRKTQKMMEKAAQELDFDEAIILRERLKELKSFKK